MHNKIILWDYDGTLIDSTRKNISITKSILARINPERFSAHPHPVLCDEKRYQQANHSAVNWLDLYERFFQLSHNEALAAGELWHEYQSKCKVDVNLFEGLPATLEKLSHFRHGICSQNARANIIATLTKLRVQSFFSGVTGYDDVPPSMQKPDPEPGLKCLSEIASSIENHQIFYIGDHESDTIFASRLKHRLGISVVSVAVTYSGGRPDTWKQKPDATASSPEELTDIIGLQGQTEI